MNSEMDEIAGEEHFRKLADNVPQLMWLADSTGYIYWYNRHWYDYTGTGPEQMAGWRWKNVHDPELLPAVIERWTRSIETGEPFEMIFPLRSASGTFRSFLTRIAPMKDADGRVLRWFGINTDVEKEIQIEQQPNLVINELNHRVKNMLASVQAIAKRTLQSGPQSEIEAFEGRIFALAKSHDLLARQNWQPANLKELILQSLELHALAEDDRLSVSGSTYHIDPDKASTWSMAIHELITNALKYGALHFPTGRIAISWELTDDLFMFRWKESGVPGIAPPKRKGFGSKLIMAVSRGLGGETTMTFEDDGLLLHLKMPRV